MGKLTIRISVLIVAIYFIIYYALLFWEIDIWSQTYHLLFELCTCLCISKQGIYHCKFIKWTAYGILLSDTIVCLDNVFDIFPVGFIVFVPVAIIICGLFTTTILSFRHYIRVKRLKKMRKTLDLR